MIYSSWSNIICFVVLLVSVECVRLRSKRQREYEVKQHNCTGGALRSDSSEKLEKLRQLFNDPRSLRTQSIHAYIVPSEDAHQSEYVAECDKRRQYISGFTGSIGTAVITKDKAALWTVGKYWLQAKLQLDCNWIVMEDGEDGVPTMLEWLEKELSDKRGVVGADPRLVSAKDWMEWNKELRERFITLEPISDNLVDVIWENRPQCSDEEIEVLPLRYAGVSWEDKIDMVREEIRKKDVEALVVTALDEVAWMFNLRGQDIPYNPVFRSYSIITQKEIHLFIDNVKTTERVATHLNILCSTKRKCVQAHAYEDIFTFLPTQTWKKVLIPSKYAYSGGASYAIYHKLNEDSVLMGPSLVLFLKAAKNPVERQGMRNAHIKDAVAVISFLAMLEKEIEDDDGEEFTEMSAAKKLIEYRAEQDGFKGPSFSTIAGYGSHGAIIHYKSTKATDVKIGRDSLLLLDSGGQYLDGTTDVTRTLHYGTPTPQEIDLYTRVLLGSINLAMLEMPDGTKDSTIDVLARAPLYEVGKRYYHGTGHGIGAYLNVHESPVQLRIYNPEQHEMHEGYFFSDEPGYYENGEFGIRLETILETVWRRNTSYGTFLGFDPVSLVPFEPKLIDYNMLDRKQTQWLNNYNKKIREKVGPLLKDLDDDDDDADAYEWMMKRTEPIEYRSSTAAGTANARASVSLLLICSALVIISACKQ